MHRDGSEIREMTRSRVRRKDCGTTQSWQTGHYASLLCEYCYSSIEEYHKNMHGAIEKLMRRCHDWSVIGGARIPCCPNCLARHGVEGQAEIGPPGSGGDAQQTNE